MRSATVLRKKPISIGGLPASAIGDRRPDDDVRGARVAVEQNLERGQEEHEQRRVFGGGETFQLFW